MSGAAAAREPVVPIARSTMNRLTEKGEVGVRLLTISTARLRHDDGGPSQLSSVAGGPKTLFHPHGWGGTNNKPLCTSGQMGIYQALR